MMLNLYPYNNGHLMIAPYEHVGSLEEVDAATLAESDDSGTSWHCMRYV